MLQLPVVEMSRILVVEDEQHLADGLRFNLEAEGIRSRWWIAAKRRSSCCSSNRRAIRCGVLDVMLPGKDGFSVMSELRQAGQFVPTLMLTARGHPDDVLHGFAAGADDYLTKPFELAILIARIHGLLRRRRWLQAQPAFAAPVVEPKEVFTFGDQSEKGFDFELLELSVREQVFRLTLMEGNLLRYFLQHEGKPVSRKTMLQDVWGLQENTDTRPIDNFIVRLRRYIEDDPTSPRHLLTVRGIGYRFVAHPGRSK